MDTDANTQPLRANLKISIDEAVDRIGHGEFQKQILFAAGTAFMADSMEIMLLSFLTLVLQKEWEWEGDHPIQIPIITASMFAGALAGTAYLGPLGDRIGRKPVMSYAAFIISFFGLITSFCNNFSTLVFVRFMVGFGIGGLTVPFDILAEFLPTEERGKYLLLIEYFWTIGSMSVPILGYLSFELTYSWRLFVALCAIPCIISMFATMKYVPESPRWLIMKGRNQEALNILMHAATVNGHDSQLVFPEGCVIECDEVESSDFKDLFKPKWKRITILLWLVWWGFAFSYYGAIMVVTRIFGDEANADDEDKISFDYGAIFISSTAELLATAIVIGLVDRIGRISTQSFSYLIGGIGLFILCLSSTLNASRFVLIILAFVVRICEMAGSCVTWISTAEILSTEIRSTGHSAANAVARIGGFCSPFLIAGDISLMNIGIVMLTVHCATAFFVSQLPETKGIELGKVSNEEALQHRNQANSELMELA